MEFKIDSIPITRLGKQTTLNAEQSWTLKVKLTNEIDVFNLLPSQKQLHLSTKWNCIRLSSIAKQLEHMSNLLN